MYYITYFLQFATLLLCNMGFILLGARALKVQFLLLINMLAIFFS
jgi:hypothetical protein